MVALFSSLLSNTNADEGATTVFSSSIPTVIQLYTTSSVSIDSKQQSSTLAPHAILSFLAVEISEGEQEEKEQSLFGRARSKASSNIPENPNLGVWNAHVLEKSSAMVDSLLKIPSSAHYCMTVDLNDPSQVEPSMTRMQEALVRYLIDTSPQHQQGTTTLYDLRWQTFGLAPHDAAPTTSAAPAENDRNVSICLMICAIHSSNKSLEYKETQAHNLVMYHLRKFATAVGATIVFVRTGTTTEQATAAEETAHKDSDKPTEEQASLSVKELAHVWRDFALGKTLDEGNAAIVGPTKNEDLIETVLLRNANCPPDWDASKDSLWKALPASSTKNMKKKEANAKSFGDNGWLEQLRGSLGTALEPSAAPAAATSSTTEDAEVSSFFENLLKK